MDLQKKIASIRTQLSKIVKNLPALDSYSIYYRAEYGGHEFMEVSVLFAHPSKMSLEEKEEVSERVLRLAIWDEEFRTKGVQSWIEEETLDGGGRIPTGVHINWNVVNGRVE